MIKAERKKEFLENRISWRWFVNHLPLASQEALLVEILKELQYLNNRLEKSI